MNNREKRKKAFIGAIIGAATSVVSSGISAIQNKLAAKKQAEYEEEQRKKEQTNLNKQASIQQAQSMSNALNSQEYVDEYKNKVTFKNGGKMKLNKYNDRIKTNKKFACGGKKYACGGKKKALLGTENNNNTTKIDATNAAISGAGNILSSIINNPIVQKPVDPVVQPTEFTTSVKTGLKKTNYTNNTNTNLNNGQYVDRLEQAKCGTKKKLKR